jgi:hypothetical protein
MAIFVRPIFDRVRLRPSYGKPSYRVPTVLLYQSTGQLASLPEHVPECSVCAFPGSHKAVRMQGSEAGSPVRGTLHVVPMQLHMDKNARDCKCLYK